MGYNYNNYGRYYQEKNGYKEDNYKEKNECKEGSYKEKNGYKKDSYKEKNECKEDNYKDKNGYKKDCYEEKNQCKEDNYKDKNEYKGDYCKEKNEEKENFYKVKCHNHEFQSSTDYYEEVIHNHRIAGVTGPPIKYGKSHVHKIDVPTDTFGDHFHEICDTTGPALYLPSGKHIHLVKGETTFDAGHDHDYYFTTLIEDPTNVPKDKKC